MRVPFLDAFRSGPPAPRVVLLPDSCFFVRNVPLDEALPAEQVALQVELALETQSPFPAPQLYHGFYWLPGSKQTLTFASYRRRFTQDQVSSWNGAAWVAPTFSTLLGQSFSEPTAVVYQKDEALTAVFWAEGPTPSKIVIKQLPAEIEPEALEKEKQQLLQELGSPGKVLWLAEAPQITASTDEKLFTFKAGEERLALSIELASAMDVRPKEDLEALRRAQKRELILWRSALGIAAGLLLLLVGEISLGGFWAYQNTRVAKVNVERPVVDEIMKQQALAGRIEELATKRLLPFEMITVIADKKPESIQFLRTTTNGLLTMQVVGQTRNTEDLVAWQAMLGQQPTVASVEVVQKGSRDNLTSFTILITFKADALKPGLQS